MVDFEKNVNSKDHFGYSPLSSAATNGRETVAKLLLQGGADVNLRDYRERTQLLWAAKKGHEAVVQLLIERVKAHVDLKDWNGRSPLS